MTGRLQIVVGGQFGSEAKGHVAGYLARRDDATLAIRVAGPNAGHSVVDPESGTKYALRQVPVAAVTNPCTLLGIAAGSEIDPVVLLSEVQLLEDAGYKIRERLLIDETATILTPDDIDRETASGLREAVGSTGKGIGAARSERVWRRAKTAKQVLGDEYELTTSLGYMAGQQLRAGKTVQVEGTQGYGLGLHGPYYPYSTSADCTAIDFLSMAQIQPWAVPALDLQVWVVFRPYPIRVAGNSGPMFSETSWDALGLAPEYTTVTKKMRRVGHWDSKLAAWAMLANGCTGWTSLSGRHEHGRQCPVRVAVTMIDQLEPGLAGSTKYPHIRSNHTVDQFLCRVSDDTGHPIDLVTTSDRTAVDARRLSYGDQ